MRAMFFVLVLSWAAMAEATQISTDFEFDAGGSFAIGPVGQRAFFTGGIVTEPDPPIVPTSGTHVWLIGPGETGVIDFESFTRGTTLSAFRTGGSFAARVNFHQLCCLGDGQQFSSVAFGANEWRLISKDVQGTVRIVVQNLGTEPSHYVAIDDLSYHGSDILVPEPPTVSIAIIALVIGAAILLRRSWKVYAVTKSVTPVSRNRPPSSMI